MFPNEFDYYRAETIDHAIELIEEYPEAELLAGGHSYLPMIKMGLAAPPALIDISRIEDHPRIEVEDDRTRISAVTTYSTIASDDRIRKHHPVISEAAHEIGDTQVRNAGTIGGNVAHADPASDLPAAIMAADATLVIQDAEGERTVPADDFFYGMYETNLGESELLAEIIIPHSSESTVGTYVKRPSPSSGYAIVGVAAVLDIDGSHVSSARIAANGVQDHAFRLSSVEEALSGETFNRDTLANIPELAEKSVDDSLLMEDRQASGEFRTHLVGEYTRRALERALKQHEDKAATK